MFELKVQISSSKERFACIKHAKTGLNLTLFYVTDGLPPIVGRLNLSGEVVGVNLAAVGEAAGLGFAIPANLIRKVLSAICDG
ncbi:MAG: hypothetical protein ACRD5J_07755 [Nitrososphaeraceae archaeon]